MHPSRLAQGISLEHYGPPAVAIRDLKLRRLLLAFAIIALAILGEIISSGTPSYAEGLQIGVRIELGDTTTEKENAEFAVSGKNVYVAWVESTGQIRLVRSTDNGQTFGEPVDVAQAPDNAFSRGPFWCIETAVLA
jgi:hypothetical protein